MQTHPPRAISFDQPCMEGVRARWVRPKEEPHFRHTKDCRRSGSYVFRVLIVLGRKNHDELLLVKPQSVPSRITRSRGTKGMKPIISRLTRDNAPAWVDTVLCEGPSWHLPSGSDSVRGRPPRLRHVCSN